MIGSIIYFIIIGWWLEPIKLIIKMKKNKMEKEILKEQYNQVKNKKNIYNSKNLITENEKYFFDIIRKNFENNYLIIPQVNLASIISKKKQFQKQYQNELYRNIDFGIFDKTTTMPLLLIEINDKTHNEPDRISRDLKVKQILNTSKIKLITFYTQYSNKEEYIINRIKEQLSAND